jgi:XRE family transcriptional regulator, aerobic/anaerobic benzoate catabolism transcriptional regulator
MNANPLLVRFGGRLRELRQATGLSLAELAREADVSRRYMTEAEAGRANPSLVILGQLALALGVSLTELTDLPLRGYRGERLALVGLRGAGKSTVGRLLATELEARFVELDHEVEELAGLSLGEIFDLHGEQHFHRLEAEALERVLKSGDRLVLAAGGSIVSAPENYERLRKTCRTVWLKALPEEHFQRVAMQGDRRPMQNRPRAMQELQELLDEREPLYKRCEFTVETSGVSPEEVAERSARLLGV